MRGIDGRRFGLVAGVALTIGSLLGIFVPAHAQTEGDGPKEEPVTSQIGGVVAPVTGTKLPDFQSPQPVAPGTLPVGMLGGKPRYTSYVKMTVPAIPSGSLIDRFDLVLTQTDVSYALESPAFRAAVLAGLEAYETHDPAAFTEFLGAVADQTSPLATNAPT